jgi:hypothetical protein
MSGVTWEFVPVFAGLLVVMAVVAYLILGRSSATRTHAGVPRAAKRLGARPRLGVGDHTASEPGRRFSQASTRQVQPIARNFELLDDSDTKSDLAFLFTKSGPQAGLPVPLGSRVTRIGRDSRWADHVVDDNAVSAIHLSIRHKNGTFVLTDLDSENGTTVNGQRVFRHELVRRDVIVIGRTTFIFMQLQTPTRGTAMQ